MKSAFWAGLILAMTASPVSARLPCTAPMADKETPGACFSPALRRSLQGQVTVEVAPVHELFYVVMALTQTGRRQRSLVERDTAYHRSVMAHFSRFETDPAIAAVDELLSKDLANHIEPKINASGYILSRNNALQKQSRYTQIRGTADSFAPLAPLLEAFAKRADFWKFYHTTTSQMSYRRAIRFYRTQAGLTEMSAWLRRQFPTVVPYDHVRIVVSPLTSGWQHQDVVADATFRELVLDVNFEASLVKPKATAAEQFRGSYILFTELNHGSINPIGDRHEAAINAVLAPRMKEFNANIANSQYNTPKLLFLEYMNWGLIPLYACDTLPANDCIYFQKLTLDEMAARGEFRHYPEFQQFLTQAYRNRPAGKTLADIFPDIIAWFAQADSRPIESTR